MSLRLGTRGSALALAQAELVAGALGGADVVPITTSGDQRPGGPTTAPPGDKSRFVREIEQALLDREVDLAVHSAKDLPGELPDGLRVVGVPRREDPRDVLAAAAGADALADLVDGARVGTSSLRRRAQLLALRPDLEVVELHGNVDTRLRRLDEDELDAIVLAAAGLARLGREGEIAFHLGLEEMTPAPGQGSLALEGGEDEEAAEAAASITDPHALVELTAERAAVGALGASCNTPVGVCARLGDDELTVHGFAGLPDGSEWVRDRVGGDPEQPAALGEALAERMMAAGAGELLERAERQVPA